MDSEKTLKSDEKCGSLCMGNCGDEVPIAPNQIKGTGGGSQPVDPMRPECDYCGKEGHCTEGITYPLSGVESTHSTAKFEDESLNKSESSSEEAEDDDPKY